MAETQATHRGISGGREDIRDLRKSFAEGDSASRKKLIDGYHDLGCFENLDPEADELSDHDARVLLANKRGYAHWVKYYDYLDPGVRDVITSIQRNDLEGLKRALSLDHRAANPNYREGYEPIDPEFRNFNNDSIPLFEVSENVFSGTIPVDTHEYEMAEALIEAGGDPDFDHGHPLTAAVSYNAINVVRALLDGGATIDGPYGHGCPMAFAMHFGFTQVTEQLASAGAKLDLRFAAGIGYLTTLKSFILTDGTLKESAGELADPYTRSESPDDPGRYRMERTRENVLHQALYFACRAGKLDAAAFLLEQGIDLNAPVPGLDVNATALHWCSWWGTSEGNTVDWAETEKRCIGATRFLLEHGADPMNTQAHNNSTPLDWASSDSVKAVISEHIKV